VQLFLNQKQNLLLLKHLLNLSNKKKK